jgi:hypothetical protein
MRITLLRRGHPEAVPGVPPAPVVEADVVEVDLADLVGDDDAFTCSTCGRTDLPPAGNWDPPICQECDAQINFDAEVERG